MKREFALIAFGSIGSSKVTTLLTMAVLLHKAAPHVTFKFGDPTMEARFNSFLENPTIPPADEDFVITIDEVTT